MKTFKLVLASLAAAVALASVCFSQAKTIRFADNSTLEVAHEQKTTEDLSAKSVLKIEYKDFLAAFGSIGKAAPPLDAKMLKKLTRTNRALALKIKGIRSAYEVFQGDTKFYFAAFNTVNYDNFRTCGESAPCEIKCQAIVIRVKDGDKTENILIIKSMQKIK